MHIRLRAPLLSAALSMVRIWIMVVAPWLSSSDLAGPLETRTSARTCGATAAARAIETMSPSRHSPFSSCASSFVVRRMYLPYAACLIERSISTAIVFCILLLTTLPVSVRSRRRLRRCVLAARSSLATLFGACAACSPITVFTRAMFGDLAELVRLHGLADRRRMRRLNCSRRSLSSSRLQVRPGSCHVILWRFINAPAV